MLSLNLIHCLEHMDTSTCICIYFSILFQFMYRYTHRLCQLAIEHSTTPQIYWIHVYKTMYQTILMKEMIDLKALSVYTVLSLIHTKQEKLTTHINRFIFKKLTPIRLTNRVNSILKMNSLTNVMQKHQMLYFKILKVQHLQQLILIRNIVT